MAAARWSLRGRLTWLISLITIVPVLCAFVVGGLFLESSVTRELESLAIDETQETLEALRRTDSPVRDFPAICHLLSSFHPDMRLAWRLFDPRTGSVIREYGPAGTLAHARFSETSLDRTESVARGVLVRLAEAPDGMRLALVVQGNHQVGFLGRYWVAAALMTAAASVVALVASRLVARRVAALLQRVADDVRASRRDRAELQDDAGSPDEIRHVVESLREEMGRIRSEYEKSRLFTAGLAHELRSPLQNLIGQAEITLIRRRELPAYEEVLRSQLEDLSELSDAVDNLLTMCTAREVGRAKSGEEFDVAAEAELRLKRERARASREGIEMDVLVSGDTRLAGDREAVLRALRNVVANAVDWTPRGGRVRVSIDGLPSQVVVTVDDSGPGVPLEFREKVFEPFFQGPAKDRRRMGYGLGLAIAKSTVEDHHGRMDVEGSPLGGARFRMTFVRDEREAGPASRSGRTPETAEVQRAGA